MEQRRHCEERLLRGLQIKRLTGSGRVTIEVLAMNDIRRMALRMALVAEQDI